MKAPRRTRRLMERGWRRWRRRRRRRAAWHHHHTKY